MKKLVIAMMMVSASLTAMADDAAATEGKMLLASNGARLGAVYRVTPDGSAQLIVDGKMVTIPANTISVVDGKLQTSLSKADVRKLR